MSQTNAPPVQRRAFTLTELLVVIAIIAMLVALVSVGVMSAMGRAKATRIKTELDQIDMAMRSYKEKYGAYPPCDLRNPMTNAALKQHIAMAFPRYNLANLANELQLCGLDTTNFRPDQALYFFLRGFSPDPTNPFVSPKNEQIVNGFIPGTPTIVKLTPFMEFDVTRLAAVEDGGSGMGVDVLDGSGNRDLTRIMPSYFPTGTTPGTTGAPYVYWDARAYGETPPPASADATRPKRFFNSSDTTKSNGIIFYQTAGILVPYWLDSNGNKTVEAATETWANPDSYQLISAGIDKKYGTATNPSLTDQGRLYPTGVRYDNSSVLADDDNATNFTSRAKIGDDKP